MICKILTILFKWRKCNKGSGVNFSGEKIGRGLIFQGVYIWECWKEKLSGMERFSICPGIILAPRS